MAGTGPTIVTIATTVSELAALRRWLLAPISTCLTAQVEIGAWC